MIVRPPSSIVIVGGGTAGWMAACLMAQHWGSATRITVVESPDIGIIGVGEGSTPQLKAFFDRLGIAEADWMPACNATYKAGIRFTGWSDRPGYESYFHPFPCPLDLHSAPQFFFNARARRTGRDVPAHPDRFFSGAHIAAEQRAPIAPRSFPVNLSYGYHFDATLVGRVLRDHAVGKLGVIHREATIDQVERCDDGGIAAVVTSDGARIGGDLFVDASGFRGLLIQQTLGVPFISFGDALFNDSAVALPTLRDDPHKLSVETRATALSAGWAWRIPLTNRYGNGYVYSSRYLTADAAETELRAHLGVDDNIPARHLSMKVGRVADSWHGNCLAVGLSQGFIEPLEATALHIVQATIEHFIAAHDSGSDAARVKFNSSIAVRYDGIRDYIIAHYRLSRRSDTPYWRDAAKVEALSDNLKAIMTAWFTGADMEAEIARLGIGGYYPATSWHCLMAGYGQFPADAKMRAPEPGLPVADMAQIDDFIARCTMNFPDHAATVAALGRGSVE
jgi:tryptophan 6-halogenase